MGPDATSKRVGRVLNKLLPAAVQPGDTIVFYFAGHVELERPPHSGPRDRVPYLVTYDAEPGNLNFTSCRRDDVLAYLNGSAAAHCLMLLDACYSGGERIASLPSHTKVMATRGPADYELQKVPREVDKTVVIAAAGTFQKAAESPELGHGVFTYALLEALRGAADEDRDGGITLDELWRYVRDEVPRLTGNLQSPIRHVPPGLPPFSSIPVVPNR